MKGLLIKDFRLLMQRKSFFLILLVTTVLMSFSIDDNTFVVSWITIIMGITSLGSLSYDEYDNCMPFLLTLPLSRSDYGIEKYLFGFICGLAGWLFATAVALLSSLISGKQVGEMAGFFLSLPLLIILLALCIPVELKWGAEKGRIYLLGIYGICFALVAIARYLLPHAPALANSLPQLLSFKAFLLIVAALSALILAISISLSVHIVSKKEY